MKRTILALLALATMEVFGWATNIGKHSVYFDGVDHSMEYRKGDTVGFRIVVLAGSFNPQDSIFLTHGTPFRFDTLYFRDAVISDAGEGNTIVTFKLVIPEMGTASEFSPYVNGNIEVFTPLKIGKATAVLDELFVSNKEIDYYLDMNGRVVQEPKGMGIVVYTDGTRSKSIFQ